MRRWVWRILLMAVMMAALAGTAVAADPVTLDNGVVLTQDGSGWKVTGYTGGGGRVVLPSAYDKKPVTSVGASAFKTSNGRRVTEVVFPNTITNVGSSAFENCSNLKTVLFLPDSTGDVTIEKNAFSGTGVSMLVLPDKLVSIGESAFANNTSLAKVTIPDSVTAIGSKAFANNKNLKTVYIPEALKNAATKPVSKDAFANTQLESIHYGGNDEADIFNKIFEAMPPGLWRDEIHLATDSTHINPPTCEDNGLVMGGGFCRETGEVQTEVCRDLAGDEITIEALGHDYQEPLDEFAAEAAKHAPCQAWTWTYDATCSRCGEELKGLTKDIAATEEHNMAMVPGSEKVTPATCKDEGLRTWTEKCQNANCTEEAEKEEVLPKTDGHDYHGFDDFDTLSDADKAKYFQEVSIKSMTCQEDGLNGYRRICTVCEQLEPCDVCDGGGEIPEDHWTTETQKHLTEVIAKDPDTYHSQHTDDAEIVSEEWEVQDCATGGTKTTTYRCRICGDEFEVTEDVAAGTHVPNQPETTEREATCTQEGHLHRDAIVCTICGTVIEPEVDTVIPMTAHTWENPKPDPDKADQDKAATCGEAGVAHVIVTCSVCGKTEAQAIEIPATGTHTYGDWTVTKQPTATEAGEESRTCSVCGKVDTRALPATGTPSDPDDPDNPSKPEDSTYKIELVQSSNGTFSANRTTAKQGELVTVTYTPDSGYVLDMIRVIGGSSLVSYTDLGGGQFRFTMPASNVEVRVTFDRKDADYSENWADGFGNDGDGSRSDPRRTTDVMPVQSEGHSVPKADAHEQVFRDVPTGHWAAGEINWASEMGYMSGSGGRFNPDGLITHQQMWMVLARLTGANPANMAEARSWAVRGGYADGSSPTGAVKRHQLVTALYRCARLTGSVSRNNTSLAGYTDSGAVPARARDAFSWALTSGVVSGDANGRLNPAKNLTRAEFAVILYCYSQRL